MLGKPNDEMHALWFSETRRQRPLTMLIVERGVSEACQREFPVKRGLMHKGGGGKCNKQMSTRIMSYGRRRRKRKLASLCQTAKPTRTSDC